MPMSGKYLPTTEASVRQSSPSKDPPEIICVNPAKAGVLKYFGVQCQKCPRTTGNEFCRKSLADPVHTLYLLSEATESQQPESQDEQFTSFSQLTERIELRRHGWLRREMPRLGLLLEHVSRRHSTRFAWLATFMAQFFDMQLDITAHVGREEDEIFPQIRELDRVRLQSPAPPHLAAHLSELQTQHRHFNKLVSNLRSWTNNYTPTNDTPADLRQLTAALQIFDREHTRHLHEEDVMLFPQVLRRLANPHAAA